MIQVARVLANEEGAHQLLKNVVQIRGARRIGERDALGAILRAHVDHVFAVLLQQLHGFDDDGRCQPIHLQHRRGGGPVQIRGVGKLPGGLLRLRGVRIRHGHGADSHYTCKQTSTANPSHIDNLGNDFTASVLTVLIVLPLGTGRSPVTQDPPLHWIDTCHIL